MSEISQNCQKCLKNLTIPRWVDIYIIRVEKTDCDTIYESQSPGVPPSPCFPIFLARTTFVLESLPEAKNPGQDAFLGDFVFNSSYSRDNSLLD